MGWKDAPAVGAVATQAPSWASAPAVEANTSTPAPEQPGIAQRILRQLGLTVRAGTQGVADLMALPGYVYDKAADAAGIGGVRFNSHEAVGSLLTKMGLPVPGSATERISQDVVGAMVPAAGQVKAAELVSEAKPVSVFWQKLAEALAQGPKTQIVSAGTGAGAASVARESGAGPVVQTTAGLAGAAAPSVVQGVGSMAVRGAARGGEAGRLKTAENIKTFEDAGTTPTVGQATENRGARLTEALMGKTPGSAGVMARQAAGQATDLGNNVGELADQLSTKTGAAPAGRAIKEGIIADQGFRDYFKARQGALYDKLDQYIPQDKPVDMTNTVNALRDLNADIPGAPALSKFFKNAKIQGIEQAMNSDTQGMTTRLPYQAMKKLRTLVGKEMADSSIVSDVPRSKWTALYAALSKDMGEAATEAGPQATAAYNRANNFTSSGMKRLETLDPIIGNRDPEDIFKAAVSGTQEGATTLRAVTRSLPADAQKTLAATVLKRMGIATPGKQDATGEVFSTETFLTNWNKLHPDAKQALFSKYGSDFTNALDKIAKVAANRREGAKVFSNPSGTEAAMTTRLGVGGVLYGLLSGHPMASAELAGGMAASHIGAKYLMTNPGFVKWLAKTTTMPAGAIPGQINALEQMASQQQGPQGDAMRAYAAEARKRLGQ